MTTQQPSIGRIVHFAAPGGIRPAIITKVHSESQVDLEVFGLGDDPEGCLPALVNLGGPDTPRTWFWPPHAPVEVIVGKDLGAEDVRALMGAQPKDQALELAVELFDAYNEQGPNPWKTWDGKEVPRWDALNDQVRAKWTAVARRAAHLLA